MTERTIEKTAAEGRTPAFSLTDILDCFAGAMLRAIDAKYGTDGKRKEKEGGSWE